jgi:hypothetical protein
LKAIARVVALVGVLSTLVVLSAAQSALGGFGSDPLPASREECANGGWRGFGIFKNQGDCVSFAATRGKNPPAFEPSPPQAIFAPPVHYGAGSGSELALGDFNGDAETDVAVYDGALGNDVSLLLNNAVGGWTLCAIGAIRRLRQSTRVGARGHACGRRPGGGDGSRSRSWSVRRS